MYNIYLFVGVLLKFSTHNSQPVSRSCKDRWVGLENYYIPQLKNNAKKLRSSFCLAKKEIMIMLW